MSFVFSVSYKGIRCYEGGLDDAYGYVEQRWGNCDEAWKLGVKLEPLLGRRHQKAATFGVEPHQTRQA